MSIRLSSKEQEELVLKNRRLVYYIVKKLRVANSDYEDIVSIGTIGLIKAAATFEKSKKIAFATYASRCITNEIYMYFRKANLYANDISLDEPICDDGEGNTSTLLDEFSDFTKDFTEKIEENEIFVKFINIILNLLEQRERLIMLYEIADTNQRSVAKILNISRPHISRLEKRINNKVKIYLNNTQQFKEVFSMAIVDDLYRISFSSKDIKQFNKIFATLLQNLTSISDLPDFKVTCNKERIIVQIPAHPESFSFIARIIQEIDDFSMTFVSDKNALLINNNGSHEIKSDDTNKGDSIIEEIEPSTMVKNSHTSKIVTNHVTTDETASENVSREVKIGIISDIKIKEKRGSQIKQIREYMLSMNSFTVKELKEHFPDLAASTISNALYLTKNKGIITSICKGKYIVNKT